MKRSTETKRPSGFRPILACMVLLAGLACASVQTPAEAQETSGGVEVTVLIYSGRPNPSFTLSDPSAIDRLRRALAGARPAEADDRGTVLPSILGYQGVKIENRGGEAGLPRLVLAYRGAVEARNGGVRFLEDPGREIENLVVAEARERDLLDDRALEEIRGGQSGN